MATIMSRLDEPGGLPLMKARLLTGQAPTTPGCPGVPAALAEVVHAVEMSQARLLPNPFALDADTMIPAADVKRALSWIHTRLLDLGHELWEDFPSRDERAAQRARQMFRREGGKP